MKVCVAGLWHLGSVTAACLAAAGHDVVGLDAAILTPHAISHTWESRSGGLNMAIDSALTILAGEVPETVVNREAVPAWLERFGG